MLASTAPDLLPLPAAWRQRGLGKRLRDGKTGWQLYRALAILGADLPEAIEFLTGAARPILDRWFETDVLKATLATDAIIGAFAPISAPGSAYVLLHHVMGEAGGARGVWGYVQGGMGGLATALEAACRDVGVTVLREAPVSRITVADNRATGVVLEDGARARSRRSWRRASIRGGRSSGFWSRTNCPRIFWRPCGGSTIRRHRPR